MWPRRSSTFRVWDFLCDQGWSQENPNDPLASFSKQGCLVLSQSRVLSPSFPKQGCLVLLVLGQSCLGYGVAGFLERLPTTLRSAYGLMRLALPTRERTGSLLCTSPSGFPVSW